MTCVIHKLHETEHRIMCGEDPDVVPSRVEWRVVDCEKCRSKIGKGPKVIQHRTLVKSKKPKRVYLNNTEVLTKARGAGRSLDRTFGPRPLLEYSPGYRYPIQRDDYFARRSK